MKEKKGRRNNCFDSIGIYSSCIGGVCHFCLGVGSVREISFPRWMKFQFAFDKLVFRNKKLDRSALVSSIDPENWEKGGSRDSGFSKLWLLSGLLSFTSCTWKGEFESYSTDLSKISLSFKFSIKSIVLRVFFHIKKKPAIYTQKLQKI